VVELILLNGSFHHSNAPDMQMLKNQFFRTKNQMQKTGGSGKTGNNQRQNNPQISVFRTMFPWW
jgi:hypothetical protein